MSDPLGLTSFTDEDIAEGEALFRRPWQFLRSAPQLENLPAASGPEIAFAGRSNVGKSSLINALVGRRGLARTSNTPGRTQDLNFFVAPGVALTIVDMPGYGFAEAPKARVEQWTGLVRDYLRGRPTLLRVFLLVDARHGLKSSDLSVMELMDQAAVSYQVVLTKIDKIKPPELAELLGATAATLKSHAAAFPCLLATSARTGAGMVELRAQIAQLATT
ncbi:MAG TPA: ribosome biogenesis GTP-binding protein YihA/YsxC [Hyphomicrobiaceae bacterium]|jgi:GTP-binding protein|nr:ribosome biogenesis GTP-binding protein YihA/YsxC [Hyphomicrobiaceae bacterium]